MGWFLVFIFRDTSQNRQTVKQILKDDSRIDKSRETKEEVDQCGSIFAIS